MNKSSERQIILADLSYTALSNSSETFPLAVGQIASYSSTRAGCGTRFETTRTVLELAEICEKRRPSIVAFSNYIWNSNLSTKCAAELKRKFPDVTIIFGGPHFPLDTTLQAEFLSERPAIDYYIENEGEIAFDALIAGLEQSDTNSAHGLFPGVHSIDRNGVYHSKPPGERITDLDVIPSPYLSGLFDKYFDGSLVPTIQTARGCPFTCTFCQEGVSYYSKVRRFSERRISDELHYIAQKMVTVMKAGGRSDLLITDSNFGMFKEDVALCEIIQKIQDEYGWPMHINVTTGKNQRERVIEAASLVRGAIQLSGSVQSLNKEVLSNVRRANIDEKALIDVALKSRTSEVTSYSEVILGLPGDSVESHKDTLTQLMQIGFGRLNMFQFMLLPGSSASSFNEREKYQYLTRFRVVPRCLGEFNFFGTIFRSGEWDEVVVGSRSLSFDEYIYLRRIHLLVATLYNHDATKAVCKFLRHFGIQIMEWLIGVESMLNTSNVGDVFDEFTTCTKNQLWDTSHDLSEAINDSYIFPRLIASESNRNVLYTFRAKIYLSHWKDLMEIASVALHATLIARFENEEIFMLSRDCIAFDRMRLTDVFVATGATSLEASFEYDMLQFLEANTLKSVRHYRLKEASRLAFSLPLRQTHELERFAKIFGSDESAIGRAMSKLDVSTLFRDCTWKPVSTATRIV